MANRLPKNWLVKYVDDSRWYILIDYLNKTYHENLIGRYRDLYYGIQHDIIDTTVIINHEKHQVIKNYTILSLDQFLELSKEIEEEWIPQFGEEVEVSNNGNTGKNWTKRIYLGTIKQASAPYVVTCDYENGKFKRGENVYTSFYKFIRKIEKPKILEVSIAEIAEKFNVPTNQIRIKD